MILRPMLAATARSEEDISLPCLATPKIDGIRCLRVGEHALTRSFKHVQNEHIRNIVKQLPEGLDGELVAGTATDFNFQATTSAVMARAGQPEFRYWVFDWYNGDKFTYQERVGYLPAIAKDHDVVVPVVPTRCDTVEQLLTFEADCVAKGFEGICTRSPDSPYKFGRSSLREQYLVKLKRFADSEMRITGFVERMHNTNEQVSDSFGYARRPGGTSNHTPMGTLGSLVGVDVHSGVEVRIGTGMDDSLRELVWDNQASYVGKLVKYRHQTTGVKDRRRFTSFLGFRHEDDT